MKKVLFGFLAFLVSVVILCLAGIYYGPEKGGFVQINPCYKGTRYTLSLGNRLTGFNNIKLDEWGPPYFRMRLHAIGWPGGSVGYEWNSAGVCSLEDSEILYQYKANWIQAHSTEWTSFIKQHPKEGKTWYGRRWKQALRQINKGKEVY